MEPYRASIVRVFLLRLKRGFEYLQYDVPEGIRNLWVWFPIIWNDRNWDHVFLFIMLHKKFSLMKHNFIHYGVARDNTRTIKQLRICENITKRIMEDEYLTDEIINKPKKMIPHIIKKENHIRKEDLKLLGKMIERHSTGWWD